MLAFFSKSGPVDSNKIKPYPLPINYDVDL